MRQGLTLTLNPTPTLTLTLTLPQAFKDMVAAEYDASKVRDGVFGAMMDVARSAWAGDARDRVTCAGRKPAHIKIKVSAVGFVFSSLSCLISRTKITRSYWHTYTAQYRVTTT